MRKYFNSRQNQEKEKAQSKSRSKAFIQAERAYLDELLKPEIERLSELRKLSESLMKKR